MRYFLAKLGSFSKNNNKIGMQRFSYNDLNSCTLLSTEIHEFFNNFLSKILKIKHRQIL